MAPASRADVVTLAACLHCIALAVNLTFRRLLPCPSSYCPGYRSAAACTRLASCHPAGRLTNKQRKRTLTDELLADPALAASRKKRFMQLQEEAGYWASRKKRKTSNPRLKRRPGHARHKR